MAHHQLKDRKEDMAQDIRDYVRRDDPDAEMKSLTNMTTIDLTVLMLALRDVTKVMSIQGSLYGPTSMVTYTAHSLDEIAASFNDKAGKLDLRERAAKRQKDRERLHAEAAVWREAADMLRRTKIVVE